MPPALQITAKGSHEAIVAAVSAIDAEAELEGATYAFIEEDEARGVWRLDAYPISDTEGNRLSGLLLARSDLTVQQVELADADWIALSLSGLPPVRAGRFFVHGAHDAGLVPRGTVALRIEAGAAFGTGHHGTTVGCLRALDALLKSRRFAKVLDVGTGTGVLAIAAARAGSRRVVGTDIDGASVRIAAENARLNRAHARFVRATGLDHGQVRNAGPYDLVLANILARPLIDLAGDIAGALRPNGVVVLSGLLRSQARGVRAAYVARGFRTLSRIDIDAWTTLVMRRRGLGKR
jgi:ribosomal protein L11 methyltransferase